MIPVKGGRVWIDNSKWPQIRRAIETHSGGLIVDRADAPASHYRMKNLRRRIRSYSACDVECRLAGVEGFYLELDIPGLDELIGGGPDEPHHLRDASRRRISDIGGVANG